MGDPKMWAYLSYASMFIGIPLFIVPMVQRDNEFALYHAKQAGGSFLLAVLLGTVIGIVAAVTCGIGAVLVPLIFLPTISTVHGFMLVSNNEMREPVLMFGFGDMIFGGLRVERPQQLAPPPYGYQQGPPPPGQAPPGSGGGPQGPQGPPSGPGWGGS
jgi:uncharacterized membrane protein